MIRLFKHQIGTTLVELIITIVVLGIGLSSILLVMNRNTASSADPLILHQGIAISEAYLEEIFSKPFVDPDGVDTEMSRNLFDDVDDYNHAVVDGLPRDQDGNLIDGLGNYNVDVNGASEKLGPGAIPGLRITVSVTTPTGSVVRMSAYRTNYF